MRVAFIGCVIFSESALKALLHHPDAQVVGVITRASSEINADFVDLAPLASGAGVPYCWIAGNDQEAMLEALQAWQPDVVYCFGWSYLLNERILDLPPKGVIGFHPAALPANRGRHPIIWTLALGLERTASTFFIMEPAADSGPIVSQEPVEIGDEDDAGSLYRRITDVALGQVDALTHALAAGHVEAVPQDSAQASHWRKRNPADGTIDWRMPARGIVNLVRALAPPYLGADCRTSDGMAKIWKARVHTVDVAPNHEPGKVLSVAAGSMLVKCGDGAVEILQHDIQPVPREGSYLPTGTS